MLHRKEFPSHILHILFYLFEGVICPFIWSFSNLFSLFIVTTKEQREPRKIMLKRIFFTPFYLIALIITVIPAIVGFLFRNILHKTRNPYIFSYRQFQSNANTDNIFCGSISMATMNICLLPEFLSRLNNLSNAFDRAKEVGQRILIDQYFYNNMTTHQQMTTEQAVDYRNHKKVPFDDASQMFHAIITHFPRLNFICLQETWTRSYTKPLIEELHKAFPWILHGVGKTSYSSNRFLLNSGLMFASRYPILDADFYWYPQSCNQCMYCSQGLLMVKVLLGEKNNMKFVGYIFNTHLQSFQGLNAVLDKQLDCMLQWTQEFRTQTLKTSETVLLDVICGDFNFDNMSPGEAKLRQHALFTEYEDAGRVCPGLDHSWTIGTEMRNPFLLDEQILTPDGLRQALEDPYIRQRYIMDATVEASHINRIFKSLPNLDPYGNYKLDPFGGKRRLDYILFRKAVPVTVESYNFVTRLASLTDHIPVSATVSLPSQS